MTYPLSFHTVMLCTDSLSGPVGSTLHTDLWLEPVVSFKPMAGKVQTMPDHILKDLSRDQKLAYRYAQAIQTGGYKI